MTKKILIMGLPGSGKTTFSQDLVKTLMLKHTVKWFNADAVRKEYNDWDFSPEGRLRQVTRMTIMAEESGADFAVCDFVCPIEYYRQVFDADIVIWMDTIQSGRFEDTNKLFEPPKEFSYRITDWTQNERVINSILDEFSHKKESNLRSILKAISWRTLGTVDTFILSWIITGQVHMAAAIGGVELITKTALYYGHERIWTRIKIK
jgi:adenylylsulfate kinase